METQNWNMADPMADDRQIYTRMLSSGPKFWKALW